MDELCKNCKHVGPRFADITLCMHPKNIILSRVDGWQELDMSARSMRNGGPCGMNAALFEEKPNA